MGQEQMDPSLEVHLSAKVEERHVVQGRLRCG